MKKMIVEELRREFARYTDEKYMVDAGQFEKGRKKKTFVPKTAIVRKISADYFRKVKNRPKQEIFELCEDLLEAGYKAVAFDWAFRCKKLYEVTDFHIFESWLKKYVTGWGSCDDLCTHAFGYFVYSFPKFVSSVEEWAKSENRWLRRASAVVLIYSLRRKQLLDAALGMADILLLDKDDLVQKGYGWMLKEASNNYPEEVFSYVMKNKRIMPRTALRYAIEKLSPELRKEAMKKNF